MALGNDEAQSEQGAGPDGNDEASRRLTTVQIFGGIVGLATLAISQPLLDLLGRNAEFFVARDSTPGDVIALGFLVALILPFAVAILVRLVTALHGPTGTAIFLVVGGLGAGLVALRIGKQVFPQLAWPLVAAGLGVGIAFALLLARSHRLRGLLGFGLLLPLFPLVAFLGFSPATKVAFPDETTLGGAGSIGDPRDVIMIVFDELPVASLMDRRGGIDENLFPNFAELARSSTWFRDTSTVHRSTTKAVPAILDGSYPRGGTLATIQDHPRNIFTLVGDRYQVEANELLTRMCPPELCERSRPRLLRRWRSLAQDVTTIATHMLLPEPLTGALPPVDEAWGDFAAQEDEGPDEAGGEAPPRVQEVVGRGDPPRDLMRFIRRIERSRAPQLFFAHALLPHGPYKYLPDASRYPQVLPMPGTEAIPGRPGSKWGEDGWLAAQGYQRHLLQTMAADHVLGRLLRRLRDQDMWQDSIVIVTADHGTSFIPGEARRHENERTLGGIMAVPLFVRAPGLQTGKVDDEPRETVDVLPTLAELLQVEDPWTDLDGRSLLRPPGDSRERTMGPGSPPLSDDGRERDATVRRKFATFGQMGAEWGPFALTPGPDPALLGRRAPSGTGGSGGVVTVEDPEMYLSVDPGAKEVPALLRGRLQVSEAQSPHILAVALNGRIAAFTRTYVDDDGESFQAMLPPRLLEEGENALAFFLVEAGRLSLPLDVDQD